MTQRPESDQVGGAAPIRPSAVQVAAMLLLAAEFLALMLRFTTAPFAESSQGWTGVLARSTILPQLALTSATGVALVSSHVLERELNRMRKARGQRLQQVWAFVSQLLCFALLYAATWQVFEVRVLDSSAPWGWIGLWIAAAAGTVLCGAGLFLSWRDLLALATRTASVACAALAIGICAWWVGTFSAEALRLPLRTPTLWLSHTLLGLFTDDLIVDVPQWVFGTSKFSVRIAPECSGLEGIGLILAFTAAYLWVARNALRFPRALLIPVLGALVVWIFNSIRLASLVAIGTWVSPELAVEGFHTVAGLMAFCGISLGLVFATRRMEFFSSARPLTAMDGGRDSTLALLGPFLAYMACGLLLRLVDRDGMQDYPLQAAAAVTALVLLRKSYSLLAAMASWRAVAAGIAAYLIWTCLDDGAPPGTGPAGPDGMGAWPRSLWIGARVLGFGLVTPVIEELAFRGYLLRRLTRRDFEQLPFSGFSWTALLASSLMFGALHDSWARAALAGLLFGLVLRHRGRLVDAIVAHATTNALMLLQAWVQEDWAVLS